MSAERLSRLQKIILFNMKQWLGEITSADHKRGMTHVLLIRLVSGDVGEYFVHPFFGSGINSTFRSTFSQSLRNLKEKGLVWLIYGREGYCKPKVTGVGLTEKGWALKLNIEVNDKGSEDVAEGKGDEPGR